MDTAKTASIARDKPGDLTSIFGIDTEHRKASRTMPLSINRARARTVPARLVFERATQTIDRDLDCREFEGYAAHALAGGKVGGNNGEWRSNTNARR